MISTSLEIYSWKKGLLLHQRRLKRNCMFSYSKRFWSCSRRPQHNPSYRDVAARFCSCVEIFIFEKLPRFLRMSKTVMISPYTFPCMTKTLILDEFYLKIYWCSNRNEGDKCFSLKFRNEEKLNQWSNAIAELLPRLNRYYGSSSTVNYQVSSSTAPSRDISRSTSMDQVATSDNVEEKRRNLKEKGVNKSESAHSLFNGSDSSRGSRSNGKSLDALNDELDRVINEVQSETDSVN